MGCFKIPFFFCKVGGIENFISLGGHQGRCSPENRSGADRDADVSGVHRGIRIPEEREKTRPRMELRSSMDGILVVVKRWRDALEAGSGTG